MAWAQGGGGKRGRRRCVSRRSCSRREGDFAAAWDGAVKASSRAGGVDAAVGSFGMGECTERAGGVLRRAGLERVAEVPALTALGGRRAVVEPLDSPGPREQRYGGADLLGIVG
jgi:hypothetical protein